PTPLPVTAFGGASRAPAPIARPAPAPAPPVSDGLGDSTEVADPSDISIVTEINAVTVLVDPSDARLADALMESAAEPAPEPAVQPTAVVPPMPVAAPPPSLEAPPSWSTGADVSQGAYVDSGAVASPSPPNPLISALRARPRVVLAALGGVVAIVVIVLLASGGKKDDKPKAVATSERANDRTPAGEPATAPQVGVPASDPDPQDRTPIATKPADPPGADPVADPVVDPASDPVTDGAIAVVPPPPEPVETTPTPTQPTPPRRTPTLGGKKVVLEYDNAPREAPKPLVAKNDDASVAAARITYLDGNRKLYSGNADAAIKLYRQALGMYPGYVAGYRGLGLAYAQKGDTANALKALRTYVNAVPTAKDVPLIRKRISTLQRR
ncbi:MAG: tetratricopeptide repeat protein, partial [Deltaproteobacteria bacterium]|nr:tetratricopeptide repeat protein [Deltaproteobacteria bacterium]